MLSKTKRLRSVLVILLLLSLTLLFSILMGRRALAAGRLQQTGNPVVIMIDPGHGGENNGTTENGFLEKEMIMTTARAMYDELSRFDNVEVYLTRWDDVDLSLKERAKAAAEKKADFLISLHYNASESHELYGSEVWISLFPEYHNAGYQLGTEFLKEFRDMGLHLRGIKTKPHSKGKDYYGIIRESVALQIPAIIVEHCHVDHPSDCGFCDSEEELKAFGIADAHAVAKYFGLKSEEAGLDYSGVQDLAPVKKGDTVKRAMYDITPPEECSIELVNADYENCLLTIRVKAQDMDSNIIDYSYSLDGGVHFSKRQDWPEGDILTGTFAGEAEITLEIPNGTIPDVCLRVYNPYDLDLMSNHLTFLQIFQKVEEIEPEESQVFEDATASLLPKETVAPDSSKDSVSMMIDILKIVLAVAGGLFVLCLLGYFVMRKRKHRN